MAQNEHDDRDCGMVKRKGNILNLLNIILKCFKNKVYKVKFISLTKNEVSIQI